MQPDELARLPQILTNIGPHEISEMRRRAARLWHRLAYLDHPALVESAKRIMRANLEQNPAVEKLQIALEKEVAAGRAGDTIFEGGARLMRRADSEDDAFNTIMQWLHTRARELRGGEWPSEVGAGRVHRRPPRFGSGDGGGDGGSGGEGPSGTQKRHRRAARGLHPPEEAQSPLRP